jgi:hypothetical protein
VLQQLEAQMIRPIPYALGGCGPDAVDAFAAR